jgi:FMN phosphatase YigB (HAD superfamily)
MKKYEALLFDLDGTLFDIDGCEANALRKALQNVGGVGNVDSVWSEIWNVYAPIRTRHWKAGGRKGLSRERIVDAIMREMLAELGKGNVSPSLLCHSYWHTFLSEVTLTPGAQETLSILKDAYACGVVTNGYSDVQRSRIRASGFDGYFEAVTISEEVGFSKPHRGIFEIAIRRLAAVPSRTLFMGDSVKDDYRGALNVGIDFCLYDPERRNPRLYPEPTFRIADLSELEGCLATT